MAGFLTGRLIERYGSLMVAFGGGALFAVSSVLLAIGDSLWNYLVGMMVLGVGWNLAFSAGTVMLTSCYEPHEATEVSSFCVCSFRCSAMCSCVLWGGVCCRCKPSTTSCYSASRAPAAW